MSGSKWDELLEALQALACESDESTLLDEIISRFEPRHTAMPSSLRKSLFRHLVELLLIHRGFEELAQRQQQSQRRFVRTLVDWLQPEQIPSGFNKDLLELFTGLGLTPRQCEILFWLVKGKRDGEIAKILGIGKRTVQSHVSSILNLLGAETRTAAANMAWEALSGMLRDDD